VPLLGDMPLWAACSAAKPRSAIKTNLMVFLRPGGDARRRRRQRA
jgi:type II secretory pathway component GspD/PulD (secretin)